MLVVAEVKQNSVRLLRGEGDGHVGSWLDIEWLQFHVGSVVEETEAGEIFTPLPAVARGTLTDVVVRAWLVHTDTVFAVVLLTRRGLGIEMSHHRLYLAELASELWGTLAGVLVDFVPASSSVLAHVVGTVVNIGGAVLAYKP